MTAIFLEVSNLLGGLGDKPPGWASWLRVVVGALLIVFGIYRWLTRKRSAHTPGWMQSLEQAHTCQGGRRCHGIDRGQPEGAIHLRRSGFGDRHRGPG